MGRLLGPTLPRSARIFGVDAEPRWIDKAAKNAQAMGLVDNCDYRVASAESLPFADGSFDLVTCQTLLIHVHDPARVIAEMVRVVRPTRAGILVMADHIDERAAAGPDSVNTTMPPDDPKPTEEERRKLGEWLACEAREDDGGGTGDSGGGGHRRWRPRLRRRGERRRGER